MNSTLTTIRACLPHISIGEFITSYASYMARHSIFIPLAVHDIPPVGTPVRFHFLLADRTNTAFLGEGSISRVILPRPDQQHPRVGGVVIGYSRLSIDSFSVLEKLQRNNRERILDDQANTIPSPSPQTPPMSSIKSLEEVTFDGSEDSVDFILNDIFGGDHTAISLELQDKNDTINNDLPRAKPTIPPQSNTDHDITLASHTPMASADSLDAVDIDSDDEVTKSLHDIFRATDYSTTIEPEPKSPDHENVDDDIIFSLEESELDAAFEIDDDDDEIPLESLLAKAQAELKLKRESHTPPPIPSSDNSNH